MSLCCVVQSMANLASCGLLLYLSLGNLGVLGASNVLGLWKVVLNLGLRVCFHVLFLTAFKAF